MEKEAPKNSNTNATKANNQEKVAKILQSIGQLFQPFKDVVTSILPSSKKVVKVLDFIGSSIAKLVLFITKLIPLSISFLKSKAFKVIIIIILLVIVFNIVASRVMNNATYKNMLAKAIGDATGCRTVIEGRISINLLLMSLTVDNAAFYSPLNKGSDLALNLLSVNHLKINFAYLPLFVGDLKAKAVEIKRAEVRYKFVGSQSMNNKFLSLSNKLNETTNLRMVLPKATVNNNRVSDSARFIEDLNSGSTALLNKNKEEVIGEKPLADNYKKYLNLKEVFAPKAESTTPVFMNVDSSNFLYKFLTGLSTKLSFSLSSLNSLSFSNVDFKLIDSNNKPVFMVDNLSGEMSRKLMGGHALNAEGRILNRDMFFAFQANTSKEGQKFNLVASYDNNNFKTKDLRIEGMLTSGNAVNGNITMSGNAFKTLIAQTLFQDDFIDTGTSSLKAAFNYDNSILTLPNIDFVVNKAASKGSLIYNFNGSGTLELNLNLALNNLDPLLENFAAYRKDKTGNIFSNFNDMLLEWQAARYNLVSPKIFALNLQVNNTTLNKVPLSKFVVDVFLDDNDNFYINNLELQGNDINVTALGKIQLVNKSGTLIVNSNGNLNGLCSYAGCSNNLNKFLMAISGNKNNYNLVSKLFLSDDRLVFNDINGSIGNKTITNTNATLVERNSGSDLLISSKLDTIDFAELYNIYNFNKSGGRLYYNSSNEVTGIPNNLTVHLNLYSDNFKFKGLTFNDFQMESSIINSGILIHSFNLNAGNNGSISGSFNFNDKVSPAIIGNIDFSNVLLGAENLNDILFNNYKLAGKVVINGSINVSGDNYYNGINRVNGKLSLIKYERLKINKENNAEGLYLTLVKLPYQGSTYYQIGDLYGNIAIYNNVVDFNPAVIRYIDGGKSYRGSFNGSLNILNNQFDLQGILNSENSKAKLNFTVNGGLFNAVIK